MAFLVSTVAQFLSILLFSRLQLIPHHLDFNPGIVLAPLAGILFGPAGVWSAPAASLAGDWMTGTIGGLSFFQAAGLAVFAWTVSRLWDAVPESGVSWGRVVFFAVVSIPGALAAAAWRALGSELLGLYPYAYIVSMLAAHHLVFCTLLGPPLILFTARYEQIRPTRTRAGPVLGIAGLPVFAVVLGVWVSRRVYAVGPFEPCVLGLRAGPWVPAVVIPILLLHLAALAGLWRRTWARRTPCGAT